MQSKLINLSEITDNDVSCEIKDQKALQRQLFYDCKSHIGQHLQQHFQLSLSIPMAVKS